MCTGWSRHSSQRSLHTSLALAVITALCSSASASNTQPSPISQQEASAKAEAQQHFQRGLEHLSRKRWEAALAEFLRSKELFPTRAATQNAAVVYRELARHADALDMLETLLIEFPDLPNRDAIDKEMQELEGKVGAISIVEAPADALIVVDGRTRGRTPTSRPIRVNAGVHVVRVIKEGAEPLEVEINVAGGQTVQVEAKLQVLAKAGTLEIVETTGAPADVFIDGVKVGKTPWKGLVPIGDRVVLLDGEGELGTQPRTVPIKLGETSVIRLSLEPLLCSVRITPTPAGALVAVDGIEVARGSWEGALRCGKHVIEAANEGFIPVKREVSLEEGRKEYLELSLQRDPTSALWAKRNPPRVFTEANFGFLFSPGLGGDVSDRCENPCSLQRTTGGHAGVRAGYQLGVGLGIAAEAGYLWLGTSTTHRTHTLSTIPAGMPLQGGVDEQLQLRALTLGAVLSYQQGEKWPWLVGLGAGFALGSMMVERDGWVQGNDEVFRLGSLSESFDARYVYVAPEARIAYRMYERLEVGAFLRPMLLVAWKQPEWESIREIPAGSLGLVDYTPETLSGRLVMAVSANLGVRYSFF